MKKKPFYLYKRKGQKYYQVQFRNQSTGEIESEKSSGETNKTRAEAWAYEQITERHGSSTLFGKYAAPFFGPDCPRCNRYKDEGKEYSPGTLRIYRMFNEKLILTDNVICAMPLGNIRRGDIIKLRERWHKARGNTTLEKPLEVLRTILAEALYMEYIDYNPAEKVRNVVYTKKVKNLLTIEQIKEIINGNNFPELRFCTATALYAFAGMRASEIRALKWKDIDLEKRRINVERAFKDKKNILGMPKNGCARYTVIADVLLPYLSEPKEPDEYVCAYKDGRPMGYKHWHDHFSKVCNEIGTPSTLHALRHVLNTSLLEKYPQYKELIKAALGWTIDIDKGRGERFGSDIQENYTHRGSFDLTPLIAAIDELYGVKHE